MRADAGFTLIELMIAMSIMLVVTGAIFSLVNPAQGAFRVQPEVADQQQRLRVGVDELTKDLLMAGAGTYSGSISGNLMNFFAPIQPRRQGTMTPDPPMSYFSDRISLVYVPNTAAQTSIESKMPGTSSEIKVTPQPGCPQGDNLCGFEEGMRVLIFDDSGSYDSFTVTQVQEQAGHLQHRPPNPDFSKAYSPSDNARLAQAVTNTYYLDTTTNQLRYYDGYQTDLPLLDNVVDLQFRYYGEPNPPQAPRPNLGIENCVFDAAGNPRLPTLQATDGSLVELTQTMLTDGPACGTSQSGALTQNSFDADLFRVRKIRIRLRVQVNAEDLRGSDTNLFAKPGTAKGQRIVPDYEVNFEVTPRNINLAR